MSIKASIMVGMIMYTAVLLLLRIVSNFIHSRFKKKCISYLKDIGWSRKISKRIYYYDKKVMLLNKLQCIFGSYDREYLFWKKTDKSLYKWAIGSTVTAIVILSVTNWKYILPIFDLNSAKDLIKDVYTYIKEYFTLIIVTAITIITVLFIRYKSTFTDIAKEKKKEEIRKALDLNCVFANELVAIYNEYYNIIENYFNGSGYFNSSLKEIIMNRIFENISYSQGRYIKKNIISISNQVNTTFFFEDQKIEERMKHIKQKYDEYVSKDSFFEPYIWARYNNKFGELSRIIHRNSNEEVVINQRMISNKYIQEYINGHKNSWQSIILDVNSKDIIDDTLNEKLLKCATEVENYLYSTVVDTIYVMKSMQEYVDITYKVMRIRNNSLYDAFVKAKEASM